MQYAVDNGVGTGSSLKCFLCRHHTMSIFPFICYLQDVYWACERLVVWRHTRACILKQQCAWSDKHLQPCCAMRVSQQPVPFQSGFFFFTCVWLTDICVMFFSALFLFPNIMYFCLYRYTVHSVIQQTHIYIYVIS